MNFIEIFGIFSSLVIFLSLAMTSIIKLRWINTFGCFCFILYGFLINSISVILLNLGISILNLYYLKNLSKNKDSFNLVLADCNSEYFNFFIRKNYDDIEYFFAKLSFLEIDKFYYLIRNNDTVGIIGWNENNDEVTIKIDYVTEKYRDFKFGNYLYIDNIIFFKNLGYKKIIQESNLKIHQNYLKKLNFKEIENNIFIKEI
ncbi:hypothetical protein [uncultured Cetobacterium sp.]|uniref:hypothetical protein n=1 Tax=uncultured Cetobacterium sp. TaxID=527638 RepID=UPI00261B6626|nr:hypothetical protein [uncultured Cetobacterium sp.]